MRCYFCLQERPGSEEHVFPLAIGGTIVTDRVCKPCNDQLGSQVDSCLTDHLLCKVKRAGLGLAGNARRTPNPLVEMLAKAVLAEDPTKRMEVRDNGRGGITVKHAYHEAVQTDDQGNTFKMVTIDASRPNDVLKILDRHRKRSNIPLLTDAEKTDILARLPDAIKTIEQPGLIGQFTVDLQEFQRGIVKIAYELACMWLDDTYLDSATAAEIRNLIFAPAEDIVKHDLTNIQIGVLRPLQAWGETSLDHVAYGFVEKGVTIIAVRVFDVFSAAMAVAMPGDGTVPKPWRGSFLSINPATGSTCQSNWPEAIETRTRRHRPLVPQRKRKGR